MLPLVVIVVGLAIVCYALWRDGRVVADHSAAIDMPAGRDMANRDAAVLYGPVTVYYASQTGTAANFAKSLVSEGKQNDVVCVAKNIEDCSVEDLQKPGNLSIFLISTHYEGEPTDDLVAFWKEFNRLKDGSMLKGLKYTGFSLGDLNYKYYCRMGRLMNKKLIELGAEHIYEFGEGSNHNGHIDEFFEEWHIPLWNNLIPYLQKITHDQAQQIWDSSDPNSYTITELQSTQAQFVQPDLNRQYQLETSVKNI